MKKRRSNVLQVFRKRSNERRASVSWLKMPKAVAAAELDALLSAILDRAFKGEM